MCFYNIPHLISTKTELCIVLCCEFFSFFCCLFTLLFHDSTDDSYVCSYITFSLWTVKKIFSIYRACISHNSRICATFYLLSLFIFHEERATEKIERGRKRVSSVWESCDDLFFRSSINRRSHENSYNFLIMMHRANFHVIIIFLLEQKFSNVTLFMNEFTTWYFFKLDRNFISNLIRHKYNRL